MKNWITLARNDGKWELSYNTGAEIKQTGYVSTDLHVMTLFVAYLNEGIRSDLPENIIEDLDYIKKNIFQRMSKIEESKVLENWKWEHYEDGSGGIRTPEGKKYLSYDLNTGEYKFECGKWQFFPNYPEHMSRKDFVSYIEMMISAQIRKNNVEHQNTEKNTTRVSVKEKFSEMKEKVSETSVKRSDKAEHTIG